VDIQPRTTGEILDDAVRLAVADSPSLLAFSFLFQAPAFLVLLLLWARPAPEGMAQLWLPALAALLIPLTGLASGAAQALFHRRAEGQPVSLRICLLAALRHGLEHAAGRALVLVAIVLGLVLMVMPGLAVWSACTSLHALIAAGKGRTGEVLRELGREARFDPGKAATVTFTRLPLLLVAIVNLHVLIAAGLWIAGNFGGFDTALLELQLSLANPLYRTALILLAWLLLTPAFEAASFLLHLDVRTRQEGLDLFYRVRRVFPTARALAVLLTLAVSFLAARPALAADPGAAVKAARQGVQTIRTEVKDAPEPFPGGQPWQDRLRGLAGRLERAIPRGERRLRWMAEAVDGFDRLGGRNEALRVLDGMDRRLALLEDSLSRHPQDAQGRPLSAADVKSRLRRTPAPSETQEKQPTEQTEKKREKVRRDDADPQRPGPHGGPRTAPAPAAGGGSAGGGGFIWIILGGIAVAVLVTFVVLWVTSRRSQPPRKAPAVAAGKAPPAPEPEPQPHEQPVAVLWQQADALARQGQFLEALRALYRAVLSLLHRQQLLRFEPTRTNGEYVEQVRRSPQASPGLADSFRELTDVFETKWYGERSCDGADYRHAQALAEQVRDDRR
jgi:hypothetical protein